jgi:serine/tyrosine/threonine adenylyltransferase
VKIPFDNTYARLPDHFHARLLPKPVSNPRLLHFNSALADELGLKLEGAGEAELAEIFSGNRLPAGADPLALAYAGHQFGQFVPQLGDGRALLLGEVVDQKGRRRDIQLKGSGPTPFSRGGDGRAALGPVIREYLVSEAMHALGVPTTRSLAAVASGDPVWRERPYPGAVLTRVAASHLRIGTFEYFASRGDLEALRTLADYAIARHYPQLLERQDPYLGLLESVRDAQANLVAQWMSVGFIHGVMNTDNMSISGETIDYGPCAFLDEFRPDKVFSSIDRHGRYSYANQPVIAQWNLARLAEALLPLISTDEEAAAARAREALSAFPPFFSACWLAAMGRKLALEKAGEEDRALILDLLGLAERSQADFTNTFAHLAARLRGAEAGKLPGGQALEADGFSAWEKRWKARLIRDGLNEQQALQRLEAINPIYIPRNHLVAEAIRAAEDAENFSSMGELLRVLLSPYAARPGQERFTLPPRPEEVVERTFCGT